MTTPDVLDALVGDTLYGRSVSSSGCFTVNKAAIELIEHDASVLPVIEAALRSVEPSRIGSEAADLYVGLDEVLMAYLVIAARNAKIASAVPFLDQLPLELQCKAIDAAGWCFGKQKGVYRFSVAPPSLLVAYIQKSLDSPISSLRASAKHACQQISTAES